MLCGAAAQLTRIFSSRSAVSTNWSSGLTAYITRGDRERATHWAALQIPSECLDFLQATLKAFQGAEVQLGRAMGTGRVQEELPYCGRVLRNASSLSSA